MGRRIGRGRKTDEADQCVTPLGPRYSMLTLCSRKGLIWVRSSPPDLFYRASKDFGDPSEAFVGRHVPALAECMSR